jgi:hypothetical protein
MGATGSRSLRVGRCLAVEAFIIHTCYKEGSLLRSDVISRKLDTITFTIAAEAFIIIQHVITWDPYAQI